MENEWFVSWFDTKWYHQLYNKRNDREAHLFMDALVDHLKPPIESRMLDLACGKGRHSRYLAAKGFEVTGVDLSKESIAFAKKFEEEKLRFEVHDMREVYLPKSFDFVFNLFTSFGYFDSDEEHIDALIMMRKSLVEGGVVVIDFLSAPKVRKNLILKEVTTRGDTKFEIVRKADEQFVTKEITVVDGSDRHVFYERVRLFELTDFETMLEAAGLQLVEVFGNYQLEDYGSNSDRLILIAQNKL